MISSSGQSIIFHRISFCSQITLIKVVVHVVEECLNLVYRLDRIRDEIAQLGDVAVSMKTDVVIRQEVIYQYNFFKPITEVSGLKVRNFFVNPPLY